MILPTVGQAANTAPASLEKISSWTNACKELYSQPYSKDTCAREEEISSFGILKVQRLFSCAVLWRWSLWLKLSWITTEKSRQTVSRCPTPVLDVQLYARSISGNPTHFSMQGASCSLVYFFWICKIKMKSWESLATTPVSAKSYAVTPPVQVVCYDFFSSARPTQKRDLNHAPLLMKLHFSSPGTFATYSPLTMPSVDWTIASDFFTSSGSDPSAQK